MSIIISMPLAEYQLLTKIAAYVSCWKHQTISDLWRNKSPVLDCWRHIIRFLWHLVWSNL